ncbi:hypothetical protein OG884_15305 [Streptosporangium sp. NBC_01755]|uniref:hypothetical protein n=1 Tax=Streptosporangium sp. NBC_01755 TaxID=2975949 RepID=UPI002DDACCA8|nr:hypothetical protein [Streptosporangium sp. NBC_01755]WSD03200.1 hypothetical protein OG884_15305 [Streptosporangium sp. NBC_01755]
MSENYTSKDLADWERSVNVLNPDPRPDPADLHEAQEATANMCSAWGGWMDMPEAINNIVQRAIEAGYLQALSDVRDGKIDGLGPVEDD